MPWKSDCKCKSKRLQNWWEDMNTIIPRSMMKQNLKRQYEKDIISN